MIAGAPGVSPLAQRGPAARRGARRHTGGTKRTTTAHIFIFIPSTPFLQPNNKNKSFFLFPANSLLSPKMVSMNTVRYVGYLGALANWMIPIAGIANFASRPYSDIDPIMTMTLCLYSAIFVRWSIAITPANYPLFACHVTNSTIQFATLVRKAYGSFVVQPEPEKKKIE
ncbi:Mitochondrial pyruvate carriers, putative [Angomonas deanei]|uniref:Mitochondrial pyruvate carrier n=1 Tax=Angomonas deanei TaxID=59799 RepID=A0A7G2CQD5_9TRYP|nr:Mitochondrial pyruvate carriers, putative [Angomonas deanei]